MPAPFLSFSQSIFQKSIGGTANELAYGVVQTADGAIVVGGETVDPNTFDKNMYLVKCTIDGDIIWTRSIGNSSISESARSMEGTSDGGFILCGTVQAIGFDAPNILVMKTDADGQVSWTKSIGGSDVEEGYEAIQAADGGYIAVGSTYVVGGDSRITLIKMNAVGDTTWTRLFSAGINAYADGYSVQPTTDGGYVITGGVFNADINGLCVVKTNSTGNVMWAKVFENVYQASCVRQTQDGGYIILGSTYPTNYDICLIRTTSTGDTLWTRAYGGPNYEKANYVAETPDGGFIIAGATNSFTAGLDDAYLVRTDADGGLVWSRSYGGANYDIAFSAKQTSDGGYIAVGQNMSFGNGQVDVYVIRTDSLGNSGCSEIDGATVVGIPSVTVNDVVLQTTSGIPLQGSSATATPYGNVMTLCFTTGVEEPPAQDPIAIFPNPASGSVRISNAGISGPWQVDIIDLDGRTVQRKTAINAPDMTVTLEGMAAGPYVVNVQSADRAYHGKLIVDRNEPGR